MKDPQPREPHLDDRDLEGAPDEGVGYGGVEEIRLRRRGRRGDRGGSDRGQGWWPGSGGGSGAGGGRKGLRSLAAGLAFVLILAVILAVVRRPPSDDKRRGADAAPFGPATRSFTLYYLDSEGELVPEAREVAAKAAHAAQIQAVIAEELAGSMAGHASPFPDGTELLHLFVSGDGMVTIDLSRDIARNHPGDMESEYATLAALFRSVHENFPETTAVQILIEGEPAPTIAGHFAIENPLVAAEWE
jgi:hypothetical protein